eukprot:scpid47231/ scgid29868/ 
MAAVSISDAQLWRADLWYCRVRTLTWLRAHRLHQDSNSILQRATQTLGGRTYPTRWKDDAAGMPVCVSAWPAIALQRASLSLPLASVDCACELSTRETRPH